QTQGGNVRTCRASERYVILSSSLDPLDKDLNTYSKVGSPNLHVHIRVENMAAGPVNGIEALFIPENDTGAASLPGNGTGTSSLPRDEAGTSYLLRNEIGASSSAPINGSPIDDFFKSQTIDSAIAQDINIVSLKAKVEKAESEAGEVIELRMRVLLNAVAVAKSEEIVGLTAQNTELLGNVSGLDEIACKARMKEEFSSIPDTKAWRFEEWSVKLDARIAELNHDMDTKLYPHMLTAVFGQRWVIDHGFRLEGLEAGIKHGKAGTSLDEVTAYDPRVRAGCVTAFNELEDDSFPLLEQLQPMSDQVTVPVYFEHGGSRDPNSISHKILLSDALAASYHRAKKRKVGASSSLAAGGPCLIEPILTMVSCATDCCCEAFMILGYVRAWPDVGSWIVDPGAWEYVSTPIPDLVKDKQEKDKIGSKPDKNGKRDEAGRSQK
nr:hypothetical protein [Tanacetum cinerariifolium]